MSTEHKMNPDPLQRFRLDGKTALITGGSRGLGKAMALGLAQAGAKVIVTGRKAENCTAAVAEVEAQGGAALGIGAHMGEQDDLDRLVEESWAAYGGVDVLINNAGINPSIANLADAEPRLFDKLNDVNVKGPWYLASRLAPKMRDAGGGSIINVISVGGIRVGPGVGLYCANKAALQALSKVMALEWAAWNIRVNALAPGSYLTDMMQGGIDNDPSFGEAAAQAAVMNRIATPDELVGSVLYLASDASSFTTGETLVSDGGFLIT